MPPKCLKLAKYENCKKLKLGHSDLVLGMQIDITKRHPDTKFGSNRMENDKTCHIVDGRTDGQTDGQTDNGHPMMTIAHSGLKTR